MQVVMLVHIQKQMNVLTHHHSSADDRMRPCQADQFVGDVDSCFPISTSCHVTQISDMSEMWLLSWTSVAKI